ncbi:hypothetical protein KSS87_005702 [Heliosperma pusillum]|nr:hypothetical protein KSS87_005702 [Heliosperma pusillum]
MRKEEYLRMKTDGVPSVYQQIINNDLNELKEAFTIFASDAFKLGGLGFGTVFFQWLASFAAMGQFGMWVAFIAVVLRLFFPRQFPDWLELPGAIILIIVVAPDWIADTLRENVVGAGVCLVIGCYLLQEHIRASGGFRNSFTRANGISNSFGIVLLLVYPVWYLIVYML